MLYFSEASTTFSGQFRFLSQKKCIVLELMHVSKGIKISRSK
ncbi:hypothetical protein SynA1562_01579 [Synechococcus sp. A15-62]|nr:hypothetical protein SynA1562_01579 [Synechococcus sp. A15-62]